MKRVLIVDSKPFRVRFFARIAHLGGAQVSFASSIVGVHEAFRMGDFRLVLLFEIAPYFTSMNLVEWVRCRYNSRAAVVFIGVRMSSRMCLNLLGCGVSECMSMPLSINRLQSKVAKYIGG